MRSLTPEALDAIAKRVPEVRKLKVFVETGTYRGDTVIALSGRFSTLHTIEVSARTRGLAVQAARTKRITNIHFHLGDSAAVLPKIIASLKEPALYFLDAHVTVTTSGPTGRGETDVPLLKELQAIDMLDPHACVVIIDDFRLFGRPKSAQTAQCDWSDISHRNVLKQFSSGRVLRCCIDPRYDASTQTNDRMIITLAAKKEK